MTTPIGAPDWLKSVPGAAKAVASGSYSDLTSPTATIGAYNIQAYRALGVQWTPGQSQFLTAQFGDDPSFSGGGMIRRLTKNNPGSGFYTIPTLGAYVLLSATRQNGANNPTGTINVVGTSSTDRNAGTRGVIVLDSQVNFTAGAGGTSTQEFPVGAEGLASFYVRCTATTFSVFIEALDEFNTWITLTEITNADPTPTRFDQQLPPHQCRLRFVNNDATVRAVAYAVTIGD